MIDNMKFRLSIYSEFDDGSRERIYYEINEDGEKLKAIAGAYTEDEEFNKKVIQTYCSNEIVVTLEEMNEDGTWTLVLEYIDFL